MRKGKLSLKKMIDEIEWLMIEPARASWKLPDDAVAVGFDAHNKKNPDEINRVIIRIGKDVMQNLGWDTGDKIVVMYDKNDLMSFMLVRTEAGKGFNLGKESQSHVHRLQFKWDRKIPLSKRKSAPVEYHVQNKQLIIFRVGQEGSSE